MSGPVANVGPRNNEFAGGSRTSASQPPAANGSFTSPGVAGFPGPGAGAIAFARQDRGSNTRIPYARVVPMHAKDKLIVHDDALVGTGTLEAFEYDGLEAGELAWILGKQFVIQPTGPNWPALTATALQIASLAQNLPQAIQMDAEETAVAVINNLDNMWRTRGPGGIYPGTAALPTGTDVNALNTYSVVGGPNRMQRLAYSNWIEAFFAQRIARQTIELTVLPIYSDNHRVMDSEIAYFGQLDSRPDNAAAIAAAVQYLGGATVLAVPDLAYALQATPSMRKLRLGWDSGPSGPVTPEILQVQVPMMQGFFVMEKGPFLRTYGVDSYPVEIRVPYERKVWKAAVPSATGVFEDGYTQKTTEVDRHLGSRLAQAALHAELKRHGVFNWQPDGICLSKLENGPDAGADAQFDARDGQLFNIGVQGPCITKTWCGLKDHAVLPGDKVFFLVVADLSYELSDAFADKPAAAGNAYGNVVAKNAELTKAIADEFFTPNAAYPEVVGGPNMNYANARKYTERSEADSSASRIANYDAAGPVKAAVDALTAAKTAVGTAGASVNDTVFGAAITAANEMGARADARHDGANNNAAQYTAAKDTARDRFKDHAARMDKDARARINSKRFNDAANEVRNGTRAVSRAQLSNIRLMRATSSFLSNTSHFDPAKPKSRCGLRIGVNDGAAITGVSEVIVGGWCIGSVMDSAASRALGHTFGGVRTEPSSMAINVNVCVEWWSSDELYRHYADVDRGLEVAGVSKPEKTCLQRNEIPYKTTDSFKTDMTARYEHIVNGSGFNVNTATDAELADEHQRRTNRGEGEVEGFYYRPNPWGVNADPVGLRRYNLDTSEGNGQGADERVLQYAL